MIIRKITFNNFGPYNGEHSIELSSDPKKPITLIGGMNGAGKTTILESVLLTLYGKRSKLWQGNGKNYNDFLENYIHNGTKANKTWLELDLVIVNNHEDVNLIIRRTWFINKGKMHEEMNIWRNGTEDVYLASNWNIYVEELMPLGVSGLFMFDGEKISKLAEENETSEILKEAIHSLLGLDIVEQLIIDLKRVAANKRKLSNKKNKEQLDSIEAELDLLKKQWYQINQDIAGINTKIQQKQIKLKEKEDSYHLEGGSFLANRDKLKVQRDELKNNLDDLQTRLITIAAGALPLLMIKPLVERTQKSITAEGEINKAKIVLPILEDRNEKLIKKLAVDILDEGTINRISNTMNADLSDVKELANKTTLFLKSATIKQQIQMVLENMYPLSEETNKIIEEYCQVAYELEQVDRQLSFDFNEEETSELLKQIKLLVKQIAELEVKKAGLEEAQKELAAKSKVVEYNYKRLLEQNLANEFESEDAQRIVKYALKSEEIMADFREKLTLQKISNLEKSINNSFSLLIRKKSLIKNIKIDPYNFKVTLLDTFDNDFPKSQLSEGEKQMLAISLLWGLARSSGRDLPVIIDTPLARLDSSHRMNFVANYLPLSGQQVVVLSTDEEIIGPYLNELEGHIGRKYLLEFDDNTRTTSIKEGYFNSEVN